MRQPVPKYYRELIHKLEKRTDGIEWSIRTVTLRGKKTKVIEAYNPNTEKGIAINIGDSKGQEETTIDTCIALARTL